MGTLATLALAAFAEAQTAAGTVAVVNGSKTANGVLDTSVKDDFLSDNGEQGTIDGRVFVSVADIGTVSLGSTITVAGVSCFVRGVKQDPVGALMEIDYSNQKNK